MDAWRLFEIARDLLGLGLAGLGSYLAWRSIKMGEAQDAVTMKQMEIVEGQKILLEELGKLEGRQTEIAESQHQFMQQEMSKTVSLEAVCWGRSSGRAADDTHLFTYDIQIRHSGTRVTREVLWRVRVFKSFINVRMRPAPGNTVLSNGEEWEVEAEDDIAVYWEATGRYEGPIYPGQLVPCVTVEQQLPHPIAEPIVDKMFVTLDCAHGRFPQDGFAEIDVSRP